ncbi:MAG: VOC family protein [Cyclobacteriaceae bacterium]
MSHSLFKGLRTVIYRVPDIEKAVAWYTHLLGQPPYFNEPYYAGFQVGGYELGLQPYENETAKGENVVTYWAVDDIDEAFKKLQERGASPVEEPEDVGEGTMVAALADPWGNILGIIYEPRPGASSADSEPGVTALGGVFFKSGNPDKLKKWYAEHLGVPYGQYGTTFRWKKPTAGHGYTVWSPFDQTTDYFGKGTQGHMVNYRVRHLDSLLARLKEKGVPIPKEPESFDYGKFAWIEDPDGNRIELWEPNDEVFGQMGEDYADSH